MDIRGSTALVTGANRGLGRAFAEALLQAGVAKVHAGAHDPAAVRDPRLVPIRLDVTPDLDVAVAACGDAALLVNDAGILLNSLSSFGGTSVRRERAGWHCGSACHMTQQPLTYGERHV